MLQRCDLLTYMCLPSRLRISLSAAHTTEDVGDLIHAIRLAFEAHDLSLGSAGLMGDSAEMPVTLQSRL